jgi:hypothetical protein
VSTATMSGHKDGLIRVLTSWRRSSSSVSSPSSIVPTAPQLQGEKATIARSAASIRTMAVNHVSKQNCQSNWGPPRGGWRVSAMAEASPPPLGKLLPRGLVHVAG